MNLSARDLRCLWHPYTQAATAPDPVPIVRGEGAYLIAEDGTRYLDAVSSWWTNIHGHSHPRLVHALAEQAGRIEQVLFADFTHEPAVELGERLAAMSGLERVFYSDNGSTAVEAALKMAVQYWRNLGEPRTRFLALPGAYHGDTVGAMSVSGVELFRETFSSLLFRVDRYEGEVPGDVAAVIVEPIVQGVAGMRIHAPAFLRDLAEKCAAAGALLIADEVLTGFGRTGRMLACEHAGIRPDILCLAKGLTGGMLPMAATLAREEIFQAFFSEDPERTFFHGHSYTGNALGCAVAVENLRIFEEEPVLERAVTIGARIAARLEDLRGEVADIRGIGAIQAVELPSEGGYLAAEGRVVQAVARERGVYLRPLGSVVYAMPPFCLTDAEADHLGETIVVAVRRALG